MHILAVRLPVDECCAILIWCRSSATFILSPTHCLMEAFFLRLLEGKKTIGLKLKLMNMDVLYTQHKRKEDCIFLVHVYSCVL